MKEGQSKSCSFENRSRVRHVVLKRHAVPVSVMIKGQWVDVVAEDYSASGLSIQVPALKVQVALGKKEVLTLRVGSPDAITAMFPMIIENVSKGISLGGKETIRIGLSFVNKQCHSLVSELRREKRMKLAKLHAPLVSCSNPFRGREELQFVVEDVSANGLGLRTSCRAAVLPPGVKLVLNLTLPFVGQIKLQAIVRNTAERAADGTVRLGVQTLGDDWTELLSQYLLSTGACSSGEEFRVAGLPEPDVLERLEIVVCSSPADFREVELLREKSGQEFYAQNLQRSRSVLHLLCRVGKRSVAAWSVTLGHHDCALAMGGAGGYSELDSVFDDYVCAPEFDSARVLARVFSYTIEFLFELGCKTVAPMVPQGCGFVFPLDAMVGVAISERKEGRVSVFGIQAALNSLVP